MTTSDIAHRARSLACCALVALLAACFPNVPEPSRELPTLESAIRGVEPVAPRPAATATPTSVAGTFTASVVDGQLEVINGTTMPVYTFVVGREMAKVVRWAPCVDDAQCPPLAPGASRRTPLPRGPGGAAEQEALVNWWHRVVGPDSVARMDSVRTIVVPL